MEPGIVLKGWKQTLPITTKITQLWTDSNNRLWKEKKKNSYRTYLRDLRCMLEYFFYKARNFCFAIQSYCPDITSTKHDPAHREREGIRIRNRNHFCFNFLSVQKQHWAWKRSSVLLMETSFYRTVARPKKQKHSPHTHCQVPGLIKKGSIQRLKQYQSRQWSKMWAFDPLNPVELSLSRP